MRKPRSPLLLSGLLLLLAACGSDGLAPDAGPIVIRTDKVAYSPGDTALVRISNRSGRDVEWGFCNWTLESWFVEEWETGSPQWREMHTPGCILIALTLEAGGEYTMRYRLPSWLQIYPRFLGGDSRYRIHAREVFDASPHVFTNEFAIVRRE